MIRRLLPRIVGVFIALLVTGISLSAQQNSPKPKPQPEVSANVTMDSAGMPDMMTPMMGQMMRAMMNAVLDVAAQPETAERMATFSKNYFDALMRKGFSRDEALRIVMAVGMPSMPGQR